MSATAVIQTKQGIGDVIWHLPFIRAIAAASPGGQVTFLTLGSSHAAELLQAEPCVDRVIYYENRGSEPERGIHLVRLVRILRRYRFDTLWILDRTSRPAFAAWLAGVPNRIGPGSGKQGLFITNPGIDRRHLAGMPTDWLSALLAAMNVPLASTEPDLPLPPGTVETIRARYAQAARPWTVVALGSTNPVRDWPDSYWREFMQGLRAHTGGTVFVIGGASVDARAQALLANTEGAAAVNATALSLFEAAALLQASDLFVGPDSGPLNIAAAVGTPAFGLFGATRVLNYSRFIHPILPPDGKVDERRGVLRIPPAQVLAQIAPYLEATKAVS